ncbi:MAG: integrase arm-type DNA-binding domain-containing protein [Pseudomonadota bacterium]
MLLTDKEVKAAKPEKNDAGRIVETRKSDGRGLYLIIQPNGTKSWVYRYTCAGKRRRMGLGGYPSVTLAQARKERDAQQVLVREGRDPITIRRDEELARQQAQAHTFEAIAEDFIKRRISSGKWSTEKTQLQNRGRFEHHVFPVIGHMPIADVRALHLIDPFGRIEKQGIISTMHKVRPLLNGVFKRAIARQLITSNPMNDLEDEVIPPEPKNGGFAGIKDPRELAQLLKAMAAYPCHDQTRILLRLAPMLMVRPGEILEGCWSEVDFDRAEWRIPAERMKAGRPHVVPLPRQAVEALSELHMITGRTPYLLPNTKRGKKARPFMSDNTVNKAMRAMGYPGSVQTHHGFRKTASTLIHEWGTNSDFIERQLAHVDRDETRAAYSEAQYLPQRREMMQEWADYLDHLRDS